MVLGAHLLVITDERAYVVSNAVSEIDTLYTISHMFSGTFNGSHTSSTCNHRTGARSV